MNGACRWKVEDWSLVAHSARNPNIFPSLYYDSLLCTETHIWFMAQCLLIKNNVLINKKKLNGLYITERKGGSFNIWMMNFYGGWLENIHWILDLVIWGHQSAGRELSCLFPSNQFLYLKRLPKFSNVIFPFSFVFVFCKKGEAKQLYDVKPIQRRGKKNKSNISASLQLL